MTDKDYRNVVGQPTGIETTVKQLIAEGWCLNGPLMPYPPGGNGVFVQSMVKRAWRTL